MPASCGWEASNSLGTVTAAQNRGDFRRGIGQGSAGLFIQGIELAQLGLELVQHRAKFVQAIGHER
jgi:hypothetical protein